MNSHVPMTLAAEPDGVDLPPPRFMRVPRQPLHLAASVWIAINGATALSYASGMLEARKVLDPLWMDVLLALACLGILGLLYGLLGQVERLEQFAAARCASRGRTVHLWVLGLLLCACVTASVVESLAAKSYDERSDARRALLRHADGS